MITSQLSLDHEMRCLESFLLAKHKSKFCLRLPVRGPPDSIHSRLVRASAWEKHGGLLPFVSHQPWYNATALD